MAWYSGEAQASRYIVARLVVEETRSGNNTSTVRATLQLRRTKVYDGITQQYGTNCNIKIVIDGETFTIGQRYNSYTVIPAYNNDWITFASAVKTINHDEAKTIGCSWYTENMGQYLSCSGSMSCTLAAFITKLPMSYINATSCSYLISAGIGWVNRAGVQVHIACEEIDDSGNFISTIYEWTNQAGEAGTVSNKSYSLNETQCKRYDGLGHNRIRWTLKTVASGSVLFYDCHDFDFNRASTPSLASFMVGDNVPIRTNRQRSNMTHNIILRIGNSTIKTISGVGVGTDWGSAADAAVIYAQEVQKSYVVVDVAMNTYIGSAFIGTKTVQVTAYFKTNEVAPLFTEFKYKDANAQTVAVTGNDQVFVKGQSNLKATIPASCKMVPQQSSTGKLYTFTLGSTSITQAFSETADVAADFGKVSEAGSQRLTVKAFDSRSISTSVYKDIQVIDYAAPTIKADIKRQNDFEDRTTVKIEGEFSLIPVGGATKNAIMGVQCRHKKATESWDGVAWENLSFTTSEKDGKGIVVGASGGVLFDLDNTSAWDFEFQITDKLAPTTIAVQVSVGIPIMFIGSDGKVGFNCMPNGSDKGIYLKAKDSIYKHIYPVGSIYESTQATSPEATFGGSWQQLGSRTVGSTTIYTYKRSY